MRGFAQKDPELLLMDFQSNTERVQSRFWTFRTIAEVRLSASHLPNLWPTLSLLLAPRYDKSDVERLRSSPADAPAIPISGERVGIKAADSP